MWVCRRGSPRAGFSACFGGPLFNLLLGIGLPFTIQLLHEGKASIPLGRKLSSFLIDIYNRLTASCAAECTKMTLVLSAGLCVSLGFSFTVLPLRRFQAGKLYGLSLVAMYGVFLAICIVLEFTVMKHHKEFFA